jgi:predicted kinase
MHAVILIGLQGAGKSTFYERHFATTHLRISMDVAATRARERRLIERCLETHRDFVIDNTNATIASREPYLRLARAAGYRVTGYYFIPDIKASLERNSRRTGKAKIPVPGIYRTNKILQPPTLSEGFTELFQVRLVGEEFLISQPTISAPSHPRG